MRLSCVFYLAQSSALEFNAGSRRCNMNRRYRYILALLAAAATCQAGMFKAVTEYRYPTEYTVIPGTVYNVNGVPTVVGPIVIPSAFETREVGVILNADAEEVNMGAMNRAPEPFASNGADGNTPLMLAASSGNYDKVLALVTRSAVNARNRFGSTALMGAAAGGFEDIVRLLLERGASVHTRARSGATALKFAAMNGHTAVVRMLTEKGARVNEADSVGMTPLMYAVSAGHLEAAKALIEKGADVNLGTRQGITPMKLASARDAQEMMVLLTRFGAKE